MCSWRFVASILIESCPGKFSTYEKAFCQLSWGDWYFVGWTPTCPTRKTKWWFPFSCCLSYYTVQTYIYIYTRDHLIVAIDSILVKKNNCAEYISGLPHRHLHLRSLCLHSRTCILWVVCMWESNVWKLPRHFKSEVKYPAEVCWCFCAYTLDLTLHCMRGVFAIKPSLLGCSLADQMYKM